MKDMTKREQACEAEIKRASEALKFAVDAFTRAKREGTGNGPPLRDLRKAVDWNVHRLVMAKRGREAYAEFWKTVPKPTWEQKQWQKQCSKKFKLKAGAKTKDTSKVTKKK